MIAALFVEATGIYSKMSDVDLWPESRDARLYPGPHPVVAHPPCARWSRLAPSVYARTGKEEHRPGNDGGCFAAAVAAVRRWGGVLEHPAGSHAWPAFNLAEPGEQPCWYRVNGGGPRVGYWICEVWQSAYGHKAAKPTWLLYCGVRPPFELNWAREPGTHVVAGDSSKRRRIIAAGGAVLPRLTAKENLATPPAFAAELIRLANHSK